MPHDGFANIARDLFRREFGRMDANHYEFFWEHSSKSAQLRDIMVTVNSAKGPKFEKDDFAAQFRHRERAICVQPV